MSFSHTIAKCTRKLEWWQQFWYKKKSMNNNYLSRFFDKITACIALCWLAPIPGQAQNQTRRGNWLENRKYFRLWFTRFSGNLILLNWIENRKRTWDALWLPLRPPFNFTFWNCARHHRPEMDLFEFCQQPKVKFFWRADSVENLSHVIKAHITYHVPRTNMF